MPDYLIELYKSRKNDLPAFNGDPSWTLPMPPRFVARQDGIILYAEVNPDYSRRPEPEDMLPALRTRRQPRCLIEFYRPCTQGAGPKDYPMKRTFLITGASKGIGLALSHRLARKGHAIIGIARNPSEGFPGALHPLDLANPSLRRKCW